MNTSSCAQLISNIVLTINHLCTLSLVAILVTASLNLPILAVMIFRRVHHSCTGCSKPGPNGATQLIRSLHPVHPAASRSMTAGHGPRRRAKAVLKAQTPHSSPPSSTMSTNMAPQRAETPLQRVETHCLGHVLALDRARWDTQDRQHRAGEKDGIFTSC